MHYVFNYTYQEFPRIMFAFYRSGDHVSLSFATFIRLIGIGVTLLCIDLSGYSQVYPSVNENRPRTWADLSRFAWLQSNIGTGECGATYSDFRYRYDNYWITDPQLYLAGYDSSVWTWNWWSQDAATPDFGG